jgi:hypothetical protein
MHPSGNKQQGAITLVALCFTAVVGIALATYISLCYRSLDLSHRTVQLNRSRHFAEVGIEEALWALNNNTWTGWTPAGANMTQTFSGYSPGSGAATSTAVAVTVANYATNTPTITAAATVTLQDGRTVATTLQATTKPAPVFGYAAASTGGRVRFRNLGTVDSYDSSVGAYGGANVGYAAVIAGGSASYQYPVNITNALINGYAATSVNSTTPSTWISYGTTSPFGRIKGPTTPAGTNIDTTRISQSPFLPVLNISEPTGAFTGSLPSPFVSCSYPVGAGPELWYSTSDLTIGTGTLTITGPVKILIEGDLTISGTGKIQVTATGSLELFVRGSLAISSTSGIQNDTTKPSKVAVYVEGSGATYNCTYSTAAPFYGVIFADASGIDFTTSPTIYGAIRASGNVNFDTGTNPTLHYDVALRDTMFSGVGTLFIINQLTQL